MIAKGNLNNEQIALGYLVKKYPDDFTIYERRNGKHLDIFTELGKNEDINSWTWYYAHPSYWLGCCRDIDMGSKIALEEIRT